MEQINIGVWAGGWKNKATVSSSRPLAGARTNEAAVEPIKIPIMSRRGVRKGAEGGLVRRRRSKTA